MGTFGDIKPVRPFRQVPLVGAILAALGVYGAPSAFGQDSSESAVVFEEILVTASRRQEDLQDVAMAVTSIEPIEFVQIGLTSLNEVLDYTPGISLNSGGQRGLGSFSVRGISQQGGTAILATYFDDVPLTSNGPLGSGGSVFFDGLLGDVERVDILRGPQGTLYGATAIGGAVKHTSRRPATDEIRGKVSVNLSDTEEGDFNHLIYGNVSVPLIKDRVGLTLAGVSEENAGLVDLVDPLTGEVIDENADESDLEGYSADLLWDVTERASIRLKHLSQENSYGTVSAVPFALVPVLSGETSDIPAALSPRPAPANGEFRNAQNSGTLGLEHELNSVTFNYEFDWAHLTASYAMVEYDDISISTDTSEFVTSFLEDNLLVPYYQVLELFGLPNPGDYGSVTGLTSDQSTGSEQDVVEVRLTSTGSTGQAGDIEWIVGFYGTEEESFRNAAQIIDNEGDIELFLQNAFLYNNYDEKAVFGNITYFVTDSFDFTVGLRQSSIEIDSGVDYEGVAFDFGDLLTGNFDAVGTRRTFLSNIEEDVTQYMLNARYRPGESHSFFARMATGYRPPYQFISPAGVIAGLGDDAVVNIEDDTVLSLEVGAKGVLGDRLRYAASVYWSTWTDMQNAVPNGLTAPVDVNVDVDVDIAGLEAELDWRPTDNLTIITGVGYTTSETDGQSAPSRGPVQSDLSIQQNSGARVPNVPEWTISSNATYSFLIGGLDAYVSGGFRFVSGTNTDWDDPYFGTTEGVDDQFFGANLPTKSLIQWDASAGVRADRFSANLFATNLFNKSGYSAISGSAVESQGIVVVQTNGVPVRPRTVGVSATFNF